MHVQRHLSYAQGYLELGLLAEAAAELERLPPELQQTMAVLGIRMALLHERQDWPALALLAETVVQRLPGEPAGWITWAYATRRARSLDHAEKILLEAEVHHPKDATIQFNLGCYACLRGAYDDAKRRVNRAIALDAKFEASAATDPDLAALRALDAEARKRAN